MDYSENQIEPTFSSLGNLSFQTQNNDEVDPSEEPLKNPYITKNHVPEIEIIDKNTLTCDKKKMAIKEYFEQMNINNSSNEFLDDVINYNHCGKCQKDFNNYFCEICKVNICDKCYENCKIKKHDYINLNGIKEQILYLIKIIKKFLSQNIIPLKIYNEHTIIEEENDKDILLIVEIISQDYTNFFHLENLERILRYRINSLIKNMKDLGKLFMEMVVII